MANFQLTKKNKLKKLNSLKALAKRQGKLKYLWKPHTETISY